MRRGGEHAKVMATFVGVELDYHLPVQSHASHFVSPDLSGGGKYDSNNVRHVTISLIDKQVMLIDRTKNTSPSTHSLCVDE